MKKFWLLLSSFLLLTACGRDEIEVDPLAALPAHSTMVMAVDYSNENQRELFDELRDRFPDTGLWDYVIKDIDRGVKERSKDLSYKKYVKPFLNSRWKFAASFDFPDANLEGGAFYIAVSSTEPDKLQELIVAAAQVEDGTYLLEENGDYKYWTRVNDDTFVIRYKDLFVVTSSVEGFSAVKNRIERGDGLAGNKEFMARVNGLAKENLGFFYVDSAEVGSLFQEFYREIGLGLEDGVLGAMMQNFGDGYTVVYADEDGFRLRSESDVVGGEEAMERLAPGYKNKIDLAEKINGEGVFLYGESAGVGTTMASMIEMLSLELQILEMNNAPDKPLAASYAPVQQFAEAMKVFDRGAAVAMADQGGILPSMGIYLDFDPEKKGQISDLLKLFDGYADKVLVQLDAVMQQNGAATSSLLKKDIELIGGGAMRRISLDLAALPREMASGMLMIFGESFRKNPLEIYYGLTGDNVFVVALTSKLGEKYGKNVMAGDENFKQAMVEVRPGYSLSYVRMAPLIDFVSRYARLSLLSAGLKEEHVEKVELAKKWLSTIEYSASSAYFEDEKARNESYLKIAD